MTRNMKYYKLLALQQARLSALLSVYELNSDSMDKFLTRKPRKGDADVHRSSECDFDCAVQPTEKVGITSSSTSTSQPRKRHGPTESDCAVKPPEKIAATSSTSTINKPNYKKNLTYDASWKKKHSWMNYDSTVKGMVCTVCKVYGKVPVQANGAWVTRPVNNWAKATTLLANHEKSEWHLAAIEKRALSQSAEKHGDVIELIVSASEEEKKENREMMKKLIRSLYFLVKHHIPHTTTFEGLITLQIENGDIKLKGHRETCPRNATYESYSTIVELLASISKTLENSLLDSFKGSVYYSIMADESTDVASKEELSVCARWLHQNKPVEHFLGVIQAKETNAEAIAGYISDFLQSRGIKFEKMRGLGFDGASAMSGNRTGVQTRLRLHAPSALYVHCRCHLLQLAAVNAAGEHAEVKRVLGTLLTIWKAFYYSPKKAEKLKEIQNELQCPEVKMQKPSDTRWLARERAVRAVRLSLPALVSTFEEIYDEKGDAEAHGIAILLTKYKTVACIYMLCDVLHTVATLQASLQAKDIDLASVPAMVESTTKRLMELKEDVNTSTWFKNHSSVFTDDAQLGAKNIVVTEEEKNLFLHKVYRPYMQSVVDHINRRMESTDLISAMSVFDPRHLPTEDKLAGYGIEKIRTLINFYSVAQRIQFQGEVGISQPDIDAEDTESEWKLFRRVIFVRYKDSTLQEVLSTLIDSGNSDISTAFPNLAKVAAIVNVLPVTTATVERSFSAMKLIKTRLRSRLGEDALEHTMRICIEGLDQLPDDVLESVVDHYKRVKKRKLAL